MGIRGNRYVTLAVLVLVHTVTYMDRYTLAGVLTLTQEYFGIDNTLIGLVQTVFVLSLTVLSPLFGYLGDRYDRRCIMAVGVSLAAGVTLAGSFVDKQDFWLFMTSRTLVGIGEASFSTVAPTIITDLYVDGQRSLALAIFYLCIPVGSGLGYIVGSKVAHLAGDQWQWAFRVTPGLGMVSVFLFFLLLGKPNRGQAEGYTGEATGWFQDLKEICKVWSCMWTLIASSLVTFSAGAVAFWFPTMLYVALQARGVNADITRISLIFGIFTCVAGIVGVIAGAEIARRYRPVNPRSDALVTGGFMILSAPLLYVAVYLAGTHTVSMWSVVSPTRRSTADALMIIFSHLFGDASSPYVVGAISDGVTNALNTGVGPQSSVAIRAVSLQYAIYCLCFVSVLAGGAFLIAGITLEDDRARVQAFCQGYSEIKVNESEPDDPTLNGVVSPVSNSAVSSPR